ncbi:Crp/Fnr family transcriptional regulator [Citrobacter braakii]|uniref:Crp/Fnr family transcriptional regulator n=1 Tax=Citrobacter braakii TaxID=57706 RepID=UPI001EF1005F|nr:Crp/Fnr family transcriptional regulator [Citrobacter braakii]WBU75250.1 Crp/Fnr family transcriptional regulator [Citrobacter braakii]
MFIRNLETEKKIARGEYIYRRGEKIDALYALRSGVAKVYDARGQLMGIVLPGQVMGVEELHIGYCQQDIQAATEIEVCVLRSDHFYEMSQLMPGFTDFIVRILSRSAQEKQQFISVLTKSDTLQKVQYFLQLLSRTYKEYGFEHLNLELPISKKELAQVLGISISTLSRALDSLKDQGIISMLNKKEITLMVSDKK